MAFTIEPISLAIGAGLALIIWFIIYFISKLFKRKKETTRTSLPQMKQWAKEAHNHMVEATNNLIKLYEVFNEIENEHSKD